MTAVDGPIPGARSSRRPTLAEALVWGPVVLDGGLATRLEARGHDLSSDLWSARLLLDDPDELVAAHRDFFAAGAQVATSASYQVSFGGFERLGLDRGATVVALRRSVHLAAAARDSFDDGRSRWVAASVGPYGASLADGSEYRGDYGLSAQQLRRWHRPRLDALLAAGLAGEADVLAIETIPSLTEVEAVLAEVAGTGMPCWLSVTCAGDRTRAGEPAADAFAMARDVAEVIAVGVNCCDPADVSGLVAMAAAASGKAAIAYPNSGEVWDPDRRAWYGHPSYGPGLAGGLAAGWAVAGARLIGGCCRVAPEVIAEIADALRPDGRRAVPP